MASFLVAISNKLYAISIQINFKSLNFFKNFDFGKTICNFFSIWVFFHNHSQITGLQGEEGGDFFNSSPPLPPASQTLKH